MDYATNPVQVTSGPQSAVAGPRGAGTAGSGVQGFNGFLQNASSTSAGNITGSGDAASGAGAGANSAVIAGDSASGVITAQPVTSAPAGNDATGNLTGSLPSSQMFANPLAIITAQNTAKVTLPTELVNGNATDGTDTSALHGIVLNSDLQSSLASDAGAKSFSQLTRQSPTEELALVNGRLAGDKDAAALALGDVKGTLPKSSGVASVMPTHVATDSALQAPAGDTLLRAAELNVPTVNTTNTTQVVGASSSDSVISGNVLSANDVLLKSERALVTPLQQGGNGGQSVADVLSLVQPRNPVAPITTNAATDPRLQPPAAVVEPLPPQSNGIAVSASIATTGVAQWMVSRQRNGAANDDSVSQIARGGNEARLQELNGARSSNAVTQGNTVISAVMETKNELEAKHTNAVTLAAMRDEKSLRATMPAVAQPQMAARIGGVDVTQIGSVDFAAAQVDAAPASASQTLPRLAILESGWTNQLGSDLRALVARGPSTTQVQVTPSELGPLDIEVSVNRQEVSVRILAMHGQTREMLEAALPRLREALGQSYSSVDVSVGNGAGNSSSHAQSQHSGGQPGAMSMMADGQDGLPDSASTRNAGSADGTDSEGESNAADDAEIQSSDSAVASNNKPARGLVDAYA